MMNLKRETFRYIGSGSGREVFDLRNGYVVKVAKNRAGIAQNETEYEISSKDSSDLFAKVVQVSNDFKYLVMEKAYRINNFSYILNYFDIKSNKELLSSRVLSELYCKYNLLWGDLVRCSSWGIINRRPVIIDYGFTGEVQESYY